MVDLKKQITALPTNSDDDYDLGYRKAIQNVLELCNSSEQESNKQKVDRFSQEQVPVSGEHNTGEGDNSVESVSSSPVQNPEELVEQCRAFRGGEKTCDEYDCENKLICPDYVQKKCTCSDEPRYERDRFCGRCGGAL